MADNRLRKMTTYKKLHFRYLFVNFLHKLYDEVHEFMFQHLLRMKVCDQKRNIIALGKISPGSNIRIDCEEILETLIAFLRRMKNASARCVRNRVNLWTNIFSISSACFIFMLTRTLFILGSIKTLSFSLRDMIKGLRRTSGELAASISGTLCRSDV